MPDPGKILCVGLHDGSHVEEMGRDLPAHPAIFADYPDILTGPDDPIVAMAAGPDLDREGDLVVAGKRADKVAEVEVELDGICTLRNTVVDPA